MRRPYFVDRLGIRLTVGGALVVAALGVLGALTEQVVTGAEVTRVDRWVGEWFRAHATITGYGVFGMITSLGSPPSLALLCCLALPMLWRRGRWEVAWYVSTFAGGAIVDSALKLLVHRPRPEHASDYLAHATFSYPSGHAMMATIAFGLLAYVVITYETGGHTGRPFIVAGVGLAAAIMTIAVCVSRLYLGVHYFSDVLAGTAAGILWLAVCLPARPAPRPAPNDAARPPAPPR